MVINPGEDKTGTDEYRSDEGAPKSADLDEKPVSAAEARKKAAKLVWERAGAITEKFVELAVKEGQLGQVKYLFEMAGIYPARLEPIALTPEESVIYSWLKELGLPEGTRGKEVSQTGGSEPIL